MYCFGKGSSSVLSPRFQNSCDGTPFFVLCEDGKKQQGVWNIHTYTMASLNFLTCELVVLVRFQGRKKRYIVCCFACRAHSYRNIETSTLANWLIRKFTGCQLLCKWPSRRDVSYRNSRSDFNGREAKSLTIQYEITYFLFIMSLKLQEV